MLAKYIESSHFSAKIILYDFHWHFFIIFNGLGLIATRWIAVREAVSISWLNCAKAVYNRKLNVYNIPL